MATLEGPIRSLLQQSTHRFATLWKIVRRDNVRLYFTDHNRQIVFEGNTYTPVGGFNATARRKETPLREHNLTVKGVISSSAITTTDLWVGRYRAAAVTEYIVDWGYPWAGAIRTLTYEILETRFNGEVFEAQIGGITTRLLTRIGDTINRTCPYRLGDLDCRISISTYTYSCEVTSVTDRQNFIATLGLPTGNADNHFRYGLITWFSGANVTLESEVEAHIDITQALTLYLPTPFDIAVGDDFTIEVGCDKLHGTCKDKFNNIINFGGRPYIPGTDRLISTPAAK